jgi:hypothetical protein
MGTTCVSQGKSPHRPLVTPPLTVIPIAFLRQLAVSGASMANIGLSWCILHDYAFQLNTGRLSIRSAARISFVIVVVQILTIAVPVGIVGGLNNYYGPNQ